jgi:UDP-N-acetylglucosamine--N-acetylmuramyl-(pentapeptide) pyrophosphoryl-undecaprenol N-acetylglucosamine transferase
MKILLVGGGTGGSVTPLLAVKDEILKLQPKAQFIFFGTHGPEKPLVEKLGLPFYIIPAGKLRRYFSLANLISPFLMFAGFCKAFYLLRKLRPNVMFAAGSFVSVPVAYAAYFSGIRIVIHQQDVIPSLSNKLVAPVAERITTALDISEKDFASGSGLFRLARKKRHKVVVTGNPVRSEIFKGDRKIAFKIFDLEPSLPTLLVLGGSSGAFKLNQILDETVLQLVNYFQIIHITGKNKVRTTVHHPRYHVYEFLTDQMPHALAVADIVLCRAGMQTLSEIAALKKISVIVPMPDSHQIYNAYYFYRRQAAIYAPERVLTADTLVENLRKLLFDQETQVTMKNNLAKITTKDAGQKIAEIIIHNEQTI